MTNTLTRRLGAFVVAVCLLGTHLLAATIFVSDVFTGSNGATLAGHSPGTGGAWSAAPNGGADHWIIDANRIRLTGTNFSNMLNAGTPATAEYDVEADWVIFTHIASASYGLAGRLSTTQEDGYRLHFCNDCSKIWTLYQIVNGSYTVLTESNTNGLSSSTTYHIKLALNNATKTAYVDGVEITGISSATNVVTAAGKCGITADSAAPSSSTGFHYDNFVCTAVDAAASGRKGPLLGFFVQTWFLRPAWAK